MFCQKCGREIPDGSRICPACGTDLNYHSAAFEENGRGQEPGYEPPYDPDYNPRFDPDYDSNYDPNYDPDYDPNYDPRFDPDYDPNYDPGFDPDYPPNDPNAPYNGAPDDRYVNRDRRPKKQKTMWIFIVIGLIVVLVLATMAVLAVTGKLFGNGNTTPTTPTTTAPTVAVISEEPESSEEDDSDDDRPAYPVYEPQPQDTPVTSQGGTSSSAAEITPETAPAPVTEAPRIETSVPSSPISESDSGLESEVAYKPVIYLYPEKQTSVDVRLGLNGDLLKSEPLYQNGWRVNADPDGTLTDNDGKTYPYLFWEAKLNADYDLSKGFCVKGSDTKAFLNNKLRVLGLNEKETADFMDFWLKYMEDNPYNVITFQTTAYTDAAKLDITPKPDTTIRVYMAWYPSDQAVVIPAQKLSAPERSGFTAVEWGGCMLK